MHRRVPIKDWDQNKGKEEHKVRGHVPGCDRGLGCNGKEEHKVLGTYRVPIEDWDAKIKPNVEGRIIKQLDQLQYVWVPQRRTWTIVRVPETIRDMQQGECRR
jgi:hypothetical protein